MQKFIIRNFDTILIKNRILLVVEKSEENLWKNK